MEQPVGKHVLRVYTPSSGGALATECINAESLSGECVNAHDANAILSHKPTTCQPSMFNCTQILCSQPRVACM